MSNEQKKLDEHVLGMAGVSGLSRLQTLAGIPPLHQIDEATEEKVEDADEKVEEAVEEVDESLLGEEPEDEFVADDPMGDEGLPGEIGPDAIDAPMDAPIDEPMGGADMEVVDEPEMDVPAELPADDMVDMSAMDDVAPVSSMGDPIAEPAGLGDARSEIESSLNDMLAKSPDLKISDYKDVLHRAEEVVAQMRAMGSQFLKEGKRLSRKERNQTIRESANREGGFAKAFFDANSK